MGEKVERLETRVSSLFDAIKHGDDEHEKWLRKAIVDHFAGREVERPKGSGNREIIEQQQARIAGLEALSDCYKTRKDDAFFERNQIIAALARLFPSGLKRTNIEGWSDDWHGCVYIDLPTGQASWHYHDSHAHLFEELPSYSSEWDGHDTAIKYQRLADLEGITAESALAQAEAREAEWKEERTRIRTFLEMHRTRNANYRLAVMGYAKGIRRAKARARKAEQALRRLDQPESG